MIVLHGQGDSLQPFLHLPEELALPEMHYLLLNAPQKYDTGFAWYDSEPKHRRGIENSRQKLSLLLDDLIEQGWPSESIYLFGLSQGGLMAFHLALTYPKKLGGVIGVSTYAYFPKWWKQLLKPFHKKIPMIMTHGFKDRDIPLKEAHADARKFQSAGIPVQWFEFLKGHEVEENFEAGFLGNWIRYQVDSRLPEKQARS
jgi:phospholipase/carboxylesterase